MSRQTLGEQIVAEGRLIDALLDEAALVGGVYTMGYGECLVLTNDLWKKEAGGVPQHCFLLATAMGAGTAGDPDDEEVILLRVTGPASLPLESELVQVRAEAMREIVTSSGSEAAASQAAILDVLTRNEIQFSGVKAKILGTFFDEVADGTPILAFGSDIETYYSASRYKVFKPYGSSLSTIASYPRAAANDPTVGEATAAPRVQLGSVRYSSSTRRRRLNLGQALDVAVPVEVNPADFVALKTAIFGMTRLGKSNSIKTIATSVFQFAAEANKSIGQLIFDPAGEYANVNVQDETALSQIGDEFVTIFRYGDLGDQPGVRPLSTNFFSDETIGVTWSIIAAYLSVRKEAVDYIRDFLAADVVGPEKEEDDRSAFQRARRRRAALYATLVKAGLHAPHRWNTRLLANADVLGEVNQRIAARNDTPAIRSERRGQVTLSSENLMAFWDAVADAHSAGVQCVVDWVDKGLDAILAVYTGSRGSGFRLLSPLSVYHSATRDDDYAEEVLSHLIEGKIVIIDLSLGSETVLKFCSERIVNHILFDASRRFAEGNDPHDLQIYVEEAHRLFSRDKMNVPQEADPWVRLAKEAAKYRIGLVYATQEVSSVDPIILSNTSNWIVTHLNNTSEIRELSKYYDFADFAELTLNAEDVGFARVKTRSGRYIVPVQIDLFDAGRIAAARQAGLEREAGEK